MTKNPWPRLRPANNKDFEKIANLVYDVLKEYNLKLDPEATDADLKDIERSYFKRGVTFYVLEDRQYQPVFPTIVHTPPMPNIACKNCRTTSEGLSAFLQD